MSDALYDTIADNLVAHGYSLINPIAELPVLSGLASRIQSMDDSSFHLAGIGRDTDQQQQTTIRNEQIRWLSPTQPVEHAYLTAMEVIRVELNRRLFMGLFDFECHYAHYKPGNFYRRHLDAFKGKTNRILSVVTYLNETWKDEDGGELVMYEKRQKSPLLSVYPEWGTSIIFLSERFPHEVRPAKRDRYSIAGWFRVNTSVGDVIDPPR